ncbi:MAG: glutamate 5-kinase [Candidatus Omnitrophica bacterium]|nr:glutamate 5-kinase [Candidatus Omnitrophota bacterium]
MKRSSKKYKRIVIKIGSSLFYSGRKLELSRFFEIVSQLSELIKAEGKEVIVVSSGAIALGMESMKLAARPKQLPLLQAAAAIGQNELMDNYRGQFKKFGINCAQVLLTWDDFDSRQRYLNARNTLLALLRLGRVPVVNENDTISTDEIKFGDNDRLSALVAKLVEADLLVMLSDVDGLLDKEGRVIRIVDEIGAEIKSLACPTKNRTCVGGMITKIEAAKIAVDSGIPCVIANGYKERIVASAVIAPQDNGTLFVSKKGLSAKEHWIAFGTKPKGKIVVDDGAKAALINKNKSLLAVGIIDVKGEFDAREIISILDKNGEEFARGISSFSSSAIAGNTGKKFAREVVHRNDLVMLQA